MPRSRKMFHSGMIYFTTFRTEEGLPFVPVSFMNEIIRSNISKAQNRYEVEVISYVFQANHAHIMFKVIDPEAAPLFVGYLKQETAHAVNRLLGRRRKTVWAERYDSPVILNYVKFLEMFSYLILNPVKDGLVSSQDSYPGVSSWRAFREDLKEEEVVKIARGSISMLLDPTQPWKEDQKVLEGLRQDNQSKMKIKFSFYSWKMCFSETKDLTDQEVRELMIKAVNSKLLEIKETQPDKQYGSPTSLIKQSMLKEYQPKKFGKRMLCLSTIKELRVKFIFFFKSLCQEARSVYTDWKNGISNLNFPPGLFLPNGIRSANLRPEYIWDVC